MMQLGSKYTWMATYMKVYHIIIALPYYYKCTAPHDNFNSNQINKYYL